MICFGGRGFDTHRDQRIFSLSPCGPISFLGLTLSRYYLGYLLEHFNLPHLNLYIYLRRQQERGLMDENCVSFQMFLIFLSFITLGSESQISVFKQCQSNT